MTWKTRQLQKTKQAYRFHLQKSSSQRRILNLDHGTDSFKTVYCVHFESIFASTTPTKYTYNIYESIVTSLRHVSAKQCHHQDYKPSLKPVAVNWIIYMEF